jgi:hypothetical protein
VLDQVAGMAASRFSREVWWVHNNSGHDTQVFAITITGRVLATYDIPGTDNWDWEALSIGPGADGNPALYIGDTGDDDDPPDRDYITVYRVSEPTFNPVLALVFPFRSSITSVEKFHARYPDGRPRNAEAIFVDQGTGQIYVVTNEPRSVVYRYPMPLREGEVATMERVAEAGPEMANDASITTDGLRVVIRNDHIAYEYYRIPGEPLEAMFTSGRSPVRITLAAEAQGEAISYTHNNMGVVTTTKILPAPISMVLCTDTENLVP